MVQEENTLLIKNNAINGKILLNVDLELLGYIYGRNDYNDFSNSSNTTIPERVPIGWVHEFTSKKNSVVYNSKVNYDGWELLEFDRAYNFRQYQLFLIKKYIKNKKKSLSWLLPILKIIKSNINFLLLVFFIITLYCSNYFINIFKLFILFDSIILSLIVLQDSKNKITCRRLAKNVISLFILTINIIGSFFSILLVILIYYSFNKLPQNFHCLFYI